MSTTPTGPSIPPNYVRCQGGLLLNLTAKTLGKEVWADVNGDGYNEPIGMVESLGVFTFNAVPATMPTPQTEGMYIHPGSFPTRITCAAVESATLLAFPGVKIEYAGTPNRSNPSGIGDQIIWIISANDKKADVAPGWVAIDIMELGVQRAFQKLGDQLRTEGVIA